MSNRHSVSAGKDKAVFAKTSVNRRKINSAPPIFRGGIRL